MFVTDFVSVITASPSGAFLVSISFISIISEFFFDYFFLLLLICSVLFFFFFFFLVFLRISTPEFSVVLSLILPFRWLMLLSVTSVVELLRMRSPISSFLVDSVDEVDIFKYFP